MCATCAWVVLHSLRVRVQALTHKHECPQPATNPVPCIPSWNYDRTGSNDSMTVETNSFEITAFESAFILDHDHLRPHSFEITAFETAFNLDHDHLRPHSFETTFILDTITWDHIYFTPRQSEAVLIYCESRFYDLPSTSLRETWCIARRLFI